MADRRSRSRCASSPLPCLYDHDCFRDSGQQIVAVKETGLPCIASLMRIEAERNLTHEKPLVGDLSEEMGILLQTDSIHRGSCHANRPASCLDGSNGRCHIGLRNKTGRLHSHGLQEHAQCTKPQRCPEALTVSSRLLIYIHLNGARDFL